MQSDKRIKLFRFIEKSILIFVFLLIIFATGLILVGGFSDDWLYIVFGTETALLLSLFFLRGKIDKIQANALAQASYAHSDDFDSLYDSSPVAYFTIDPTGKIVGYNGAAVKILQGQTDMMKDLNFFSLINSDEEDSDASLLVGKIKAGITSKDTEVVIKTLTNEMVWVALSVFKHRNESIISMVDITEQKQIDTAKSEFVALATHQLRTPIAAIRWNAELLERNLRDTKTEDQDRYLTKIERNVVADD